MAEPTNAMNPHEVKCCEACGAVIHRGEMVPYAFAMRRLCRDGCGLRTVPKDDPQRLQRRFDSKVDRRAGLGPNGDCWHWIGRLDAKGYGVTKIAGKAVKAHRVALFGSGNIDTPLFACHRCDNPLCVRPSHLFAGEPVDNVRDMIRKGRRGSNLSLRKLSDEQVREIRASTETEAVLGRKFGVNGTAIRQCRLAKTYRDVA